MDLYGTSEPAEVTDAELSLLDGSARPAAILQADIAIVGGGLAGTLLALVLARRGLAPVVIDPHHVYPDDFRCEKLTGEQAAMLAELGVLSDVEALDQIGAGALTRRGFRYDKLVNGLRAAWPQSVRFTPGRVAHAETGPQRQTLHLSSGDSVQARLIVLATGAGERLRSSLGVRREVIRERHSVCIGFNLRRRDGLAFDFEGLVHPGERAGDGVAFASLFPLGSAMRVNLFSYRDVRDAWTRAFRTDPVASLRQALPSLAARLGDVDVEGPVEVRSTDLYRSQDVYRPGVVLIGDAFQTSCPATGAGVTRILTDVARLSAAHIPAWLSTDGMDADKIAAFYADPAKRTADALALAQAERRRAMATRTTPYWRARRLAVRLKASTARRAVREEPLRLASGARVEVKSASEILATLDAHGRFDGLPFMPEMARLCGTSAQVFRRADKTCVEGVGLRRMRDTVFLEEARCDGGEHDGCERACLMFWKAAWLRPVGSAPRTHDPAVEAAALTRLMALPTRSGERYLCQSTALAQATRHLPRWDYLHLVADVVGGDLSLPRFLAMMLRFAANRVRSGFGRGEIGAISGGAVRPSKGDLALQPGEWVKIRDPGAIRETVDARGRNNGLTFEPEMSTYLGRAYKVKAPVTRIINEETGKMVRLTRTVALEGLNCQGLCMKNCPRSNPLYWREAWLERMDPASGPPQL